MVKLSDKYGAKIFLIGSVTMYLLGIAWQEFFDVCLPWSIDIALIIILFMGAGYLLKEKSNCIKFTCSRYYATPLFIINFILAYINYEIWGETSGFVYSCDWKCNVISVICFCGNFCPSCAVL